MRTLQIRNGAFLSIHDNEALSNAIVRDNDFFEHEILDYIRAYYPEQEGIFDIGANIGNHSVYFAHYLKYDFIWAFEPYIENFELLKHNTAPYKNITISNYAISDKHGKLYLWKHPENFGATEVRESPPDYTNIEDYEVKCVTLDDFIYIPKVSLVKIDVEFWEPHVLAGGWKFLKKHKPLLLIEDTKEEYGPILAPYFTLLKAWSNNNTFLYDWREWC